LQPKYFHTYLHTAGCLYKSNCNIAPFVKYICPGMLSQESHPYLEEGASVGVLAFQRCECWWISLSLTV